MKLYVFEYGTPVCSNMEHLCVPIWNTFDFGTPFWCFKSVTIKTGVEVFQYGTHPTLLEHP